PRSAPQWTRWSAGASGICHCGPRVASIVLPSLNHLRRKDNWLTAALIGSGTRGNRLCVMARRNTGPVILVEALMTRALQFDSYGGVDVLEVRYVPRPVTGAGEVLVEVKAAGINISEAAIRPGAVRDLFP